MISFGRFDLFMTATELELGKSLGRTPEPKELLQSKRSKETADLHSR